MTFNLTFTIWQLIATAAAGVILWVWWDWTRKVEATIENHAQIFNRHIDPILGDIDHRLKKLEKANKRQKGTDQWDDGECGCRFYTEGGE